MDIKQATAEISSGNNLSAEAMQQTMRQLMTGGAEHDDIVDFLVALRDKGESIEEITAAAKVMRELSTKVPLELPNLVDTCGTGGDGSGIFNVSTAAAIVAAAGGANVAKHGNRSVSSKSGSADLLEAAGVNLDLTAEQVGQCVESVGLGFMFAPKHHGAMKHAIGPRKAIGTRTIFNVLGPLTNPAGAPNQVLGVFSKELVEPIAQALKALGSNHVLVVHSEDGLDEISIAANTHFAELKDGQITTGTIKPSDFGLIGLELSSLRVPDCDASLRLVNAVLSGLKGPAAAMVAVNAGAALYVSGKAASLKDGFELAADLLGSGSALDKFDQYIRKTQELAA